MLPLLLELPLPLPAGEPELELELGEPELEPLGLAPALPDALPPMLAEPPLPEVEESDEPEVPLAEGDAPEGAGDELDGVLDEDELDEGELDDGEPAAGMEEDEDPLGEAPDEDDEDDVSAPAAGVLGVVGVAALLLGEAGLVLVAAPLEVEPGAAPEVPLPESLLQPASSAARMLAVSKTFEGWVSFIVAFL